MQVTVGRVFSVLITAFVWATLVAGLAGAAAALIVEFGLLPNWLLPLLVAGIALMGTRIRVNHQPVLASILTASSAGVIYTFVIRYKTVPDTLALLPLWAVWTVVILGLFLSVSLTAFRLLARRE